MIRLGLYKDAAPSPIQRLAASRRLSQFSTWPLTDVFFSECRLDHLLRPSLGE